MRMLLIAGTSFAVCVAIADLFLITGHLRDDRRAMLVAPVQTAVSTGAVRG